MTDTIDSTTNPTSIEPLDHDAPSASSRQWAKLVRRASVAYVLSRLCVAAGAAVVAAQRVVQDRTDGIPRPHNAVRDIIDVLTSWDGKWYLAIVRDSYPSHIPPHITWDDYQARTAFFPIYPDLVRWLDRVLPGGDVFAGLFLNFVMGAIAVYLVGALARALFDERVGYRAMLLMAFFPGSFVLSFAYSEATLLVFAAGCLLCIQRRQWLAAGVLASLAAATRPNGIALIAACMVAAMLAIRERREWRSLIAPALAPVGFIIFHLFLWRRTGEKLAWFRTQSEAWHEGTSFGLTALKNTMHAIERPLASPTDIITAVAFLTTLVLIYMAYKKRLPWPMVTYTAVVLLLMLAPSTVTARPRFLFTAFPLFISAAAWIRDLEIAHEHSSEELSSGHELWTVVLALSAAGLVTLTALYGVFGAIP